MRGILFAVGVIACTKAPAPPDEPSSRVQVLFDNDQHTVEFGDSRLTFAPSTNLEMPVSLRFQDGPELLGSLNDDCLEHRAGIGLFPHLVASPEVVDASGVTSDLNVDIDGPALAKLTLTYTIPYTDCDDDARSLVGTSVFTFFPSNRLVRQDQQVTPTDSEQTNGACGCGSGQFFFTSFWTFTQGAIIDAAPLSLCAVRGDQSGPQNVALTWRDSDNGTRRIISNSAVTYDWVSGSSTLADAPRNAVSDLVLGEADCPDLLETAVDRPLIINGNEVNPNEDGTYEVAAGFGTIEITTQSPMEHGFALVIDADNAQHISARRSDGSSLSRLAQPHNGKTIVWIEDPLAMNETFTLEVME